MTLDACVEAPFGPWSAASAGLLHSMSNEKQKESVVLVVCGIAIMRNSLNRGTGRCGVRQTRPASLHQHRSAVNRRRSPQWSEAGNLGQALDDDEDVIFGARNIPIRRYCQGDRNSFRGRKRKCI